MALDKPSDHEDEYFVKLEAEQRKKLREQLDKKRDEHRRNQEKEAHWMKCPKCGADLKEIKHQDIAVDECLECKGVWLDAGELELLAKSAGKAGAGILGKFFGKK